jgi:uncharacterized membrane protein
VQRHPQRVQQQVVAEFSERRGPLPTPEELTQYQASFPGLAEPIVAQAEKEQDHRIAVTNKTLDANIKSRARGQIVGGILVMLTLGVACYFAYMQAAEYGAALAGSVILTLGGLLYMKQRDMRNRDDAANDMPL